ncbi:MAG: ribosome biogenesis GTPase Der [Oscillospiraceae bacterium]|nr:ribosome biogenesis GTPase Der [Oscillospiraceae bacterium]
MTKPVVAIVGRPNVGKSTFFNYISGKRISIVDDSPGVTRDRIYADIEWRGRYFTVVDTGGIEPFSDEPMWRQMMYQAQIAIDTADVIVFMVDGKDGLTSSDAEVAEVLRKAGKPSIVCVNKMDRPGPVPPDAYEFYNLALGNICTVSSLQGLGMGDLLDEIYQHLPEDLPTENEDSSIKVAIVGKPNTGKSSLINRILGEERSITSSVPGTTRDAIDAPFEYNGDNYIFIDTAGIRRKSKVNKDIERYSVMRAFSAIDRADVCLVMIDSIEGVTEQDAKIAGYAHEAGKASIIVVNKWDLIEKTRNITEEYKEDLWGRLGFMTYAPVMFISALTGQRVPNIFKVIKKVHEQSNFRASTGVLNDVLAEAVSIVQPPSDKGKRLKLYYITQIAVKPPTFVIFMNDTELMHYSYMRYIENSLRRTFDFEGVPIRLLSRERQDNKTK